MKIVSYKLNNVIGSYRAGAVEDQYVMDLQEAYKQYLLHNGEIDLVKSIDYQLPHEMDAFFRLGTLAIERAKQAVNFVQDNDIQMIKYDLNDVILGPPVPKGAKIICIGTNYKNHVMEMKSSMPTVPVLFSKFSNAIIGPGDTIQKSPITNALDYEGEFTVVIGKEASHVKQEDALDYIAGYTISNDVSARDLQKRTPQWLQGKSLDKTTPVGPWIVTKDELPDPSRVKIETYVNGEKRQSSNTSHLIFNIPTLLEFITSIMTLEPGDIILTGTPDGVGFAMDPPQFLQDGDVVRIEIEGIGVLENEVKNAEVPNR